MGQTKKTQSKTSKAKNNPRKYEFVKAMWRLFGLIIAGSILFFLLISTGLLGYLPEISELENPIDKYASQVISSDNELLFTYSESDDNRIYVDYSDLSPHLINALIATEDSRYYTHSGIEIIGLGRAHRENNAHEQGEQRRW